MTTRTRSAVQGPQSFVLSAFVAPPPPDAAARERFAKRRNAVQIADAVARIVGRAPAEAGTARLALILAADAGVASLGAAARRAEQEGTPGTQRPDVRTRPNGAFSPRLVR